MAPEAVNWMVGSEMQTVGPAWPATENARRANSRYEQRAGQTKSVKLRAVKSQMGMILSCQTPSETQTDKRRNGQRDKRTDATKRLWCILTLKCDIWCNILTIFLIINWPNFVYLLVDPGFLSPPPIIFMKHRASSTHRVDAPDKHEGQTDKRTCLCPFVCWSLRWS